RTLSSEGRSLGIEFRLNNRDEDQERYDQNLSYNQIDNGQELEQNIYQFSNRDNTDMSSGFKLSFTEPVGEYSFLELSYDLNHSSTDNIQDTWDYGPNATTQSKIDSLSNHYNYQYVSNKIGLDFQRKKDGMTFNAGLAIQPLKQTGIEESKDLEIVNSSFN